MNNRVYLLATWIVLIICVLLSGCYQEGIDVEYHFPRRFKEIEIVADKEIGQTVDDVNGVVKVWFDKDGIARVKSFAFLERWHDKRLIVGGNRLKAFRFENEEIKQAKITTHIPGGGVTSKSIENGTKKIMNVVYLD